MDTAIVKTRDTREAAAFGTCGVLVTPEIVIDDKTGKTQITFKMGITSVDNTIAVPDIRLALKDGTLSATHPILTCLRTLKNKKTLMDTLARGGSLITVPGKTGGYLLEKSNGFRALLPAEKMFKTTDLDLVAALTEQGADIINIEGNGNHRNFYLGNVGTSRLRTGNCQLPTNSQDYIKLAQDYRTGKLAEQDSEHPLLWGILACKNYRSLLIAVEKDQALILLRKPKSNKTAYVREDAENQAFDTMKQFFGGRGRFEKDKDE